MGAEKDAPTDPQSRAAGRERPGVGFPGTACLTAGEEGLSGRNTSLISNLETAFPSTPVHNQGQWQKTKGQRVFHGKSEKAMRRFINKALQTDHVLPLPFAESGVRVPHFLGLQAPRTHWGTLPGMHVRRHTVTTPAEGTRLGTPVRTERATVAL